MENLPQFLTLFPVAMKLVVLLLLALLLIFCLARCQHGMIYYPRVYDSSYDHCRAAVELTFTTGEGRQVAFYVGPPAQQGAQLPARLWLIFGGNASLALDWYDFVRAPHDPGAGYLLLDYPGYGHCQGSASPNSILASSQAALTALAGHLGVDQAQIIPRLHLLGHSLGAAAALQLAVVQPPRRLILISPFTSLKDMAATLVGPLLSRTLLQNFDNRARLAELSKLAAPPPILIVHGEADDIVPLRMGRELAGLYRGPVSFQSLPGAGHNDIIMRATPLLHAAMQEAPAAEMPK